MKNRAKCKLCSSIIESHFTGDVVTCKCGEITVYDGAAMRCEFNNVGNFLRVDDIGNEIVVRYKEKDAEGNGNEERQKPIENTSKGELINNLEEFAKAVKDMPMHYVTSSDLADCILAVANILKRE